MGWLLLAAVSLSELELVRTVELLAPLHHVQGVDRDARKGFLHGFRLPGGEVVRSVELCGRYSATGTQMESASPAMPPG